MGETAVLYVINKFKMRKLSEFRCVMLYQDLDTGFCFVKPLLRKIDLEIVMELFKIFTSYGPPAKVYVNSCTLDIVNNIQASIQALLPQFNIKFIKESSGSNNISMKVVTKLHNWMGTTKKEEWEIGCCIVQREINTDVSAGPMSPHKQFFIGLENIHTSTNLAGYLDRSTNVTRENKSTNEQSNIKQEQNSPKANSTPEVSSRSLLTNSLDTITVKEEVRDSEETSSVSDRVVLFDGGLILPGLNKNHRTVEVKIERFEES